MSRIDAGFPLPSRPRAEDRAAGVTETTGVAAGIEQLSNAKSGLQPGAPRRRARVVPIPHPGPVPADVISASLLAVGVAVTTLPRQGRTARLPRKRAQDPGPGD
jgi:hypothetical protein